MFYKFEEEERKLYISLLREIFDEILKDTHFGVVPLYVTGGAARRLYMLENNIDMTIEDVKQIFLSDIDIHASTYNNYNRASYSNFFSLDSYATKGSCYDEFGLFDIECGSNYNPTLINRIFGKTKHFLTLESVTEKIYKLQSYRKKLFYQSNYRLIEELKKTKIQYIRLRIMAEETKNITENVIENFDLKFDLNSCYFVYWNRKVYDKRPIKQKNFYHDSIVLAPNTTNNKFKTLTRVFKYENYGFTYEDGTVVSLLYDISREAENHINGNGNGNGMKLGAVSHANDEEYGNSDINLFEQPKK